MKGSEAVKSFGHHQARKLRPITRRGYDHLLRRLSSQFGRRNIENIKPDDIHRFLKDFTKGHSPGTKRLRWNQTKAFFTYCIRDLRIDMSNPCADEKVKKVFKLPSRPRKPLNQRGIEIMVSIVAKERDRLIMDLLGKVGFEARELLALKPSHLQGRKVKLGPKTFAYLPKKLAFKLRKYIRNKEIGPRDRIFKLSYSGLRMIVLRHGKMVNLKVTPNDLRKYAGISAHQKGVPLEFISQIMYRHRSLKTTKTYLGLSRFPQTRTELYKWVDRLEE